MSDDLGLDAQLIDNHVQSTDVVHFLCNTFVQT